MAFVVPSYVAASSHAPVLQEQQLVSMGFQLSSMQQLFEGLGEQLGRPLFAAQHYANVIYVDKDQPCPGSGTSANPYCSIQNAFNHRGLGPGNSIRIRNAAAPYDEQAIATVSGSVATPIIVEPDTGHHPVLRYTGIGARRAVISIRDADYWIVRGLTFDGAGVITSTFAIEVLASTRTITGHQIVGNTIRNWGAGINPEAIRIRGNNGNNAALLYVQNAVVRGNMLDSIRGSGIELGTTRNVLVEKNTIQRGLCAMGSAGYTSVEGIKVGAEGSGAVIRDNIVRDFVGTCTNAEDPIPAVTAIYCDTGPTNGDVHRNIVYNIDPSNRYDSRGIKIESRCHDWKVRENLVYNIGGDGFENSSPGVGDADRAQWINNTVVNASLTEAGGLGINLVRGDNIVVKNNIFVNTGKIVPIGVYSIAANQGPHVIDYNLYWRTGGITKVGAWSGLSYDLAGWRNACKCDVHALTADPLFVNPAGGDFHLRTGSPARGVGEGGVDMGAYPKPSDITPPTVSITAPINGSTVFGANVAISATASDTVGVAGVQFYMSGPGLATQPLGVEDTAAPYGLTRDTTASPDGTYTIQAVARDAAGNKTTSPSVTFTVANLTYQLVTHWKFNEGTGTVTSDSAPADGGQNATLVNGTAWVIGKSGKALSFDKINDAVNAASPLILDNLSSFTYSAWIYPKSSGEGNFGVIVMKGSGSGAAASKRFLLNSGPSCSLGRCIELTINRATTAAGAFSTAGAITLNAWQHIAVTFTPSDGPRIYKNGVEVSYVNRTIGSGTIQDESTGNLLIGSMPNGSATFDGIIDEVRIYRRALNRNEIKMLAL